MLFVTVESGGRPRVGILDREHVYLFAPIPRPRKNIVCVGRNYAAHIRESGVALPQVPMFFTKPATCVVGPGAPVVHHAVARELDYEVELAVIIGRRGRGPDPAAVAAAGRRGRRRLAPGSAESVPGRNVCETESYLG